MFRNFYFMWFSVFLISLRIIVLGNCNKSLCMCCLDLGQRLMSMLSISVAQQRSAREFWSREAVVPLGGSGLLGPAIWDPGFNCSTPITCKETVPEGRYPDKSHMICISEFILLWIFFRNKTQELEPAFIFTDWCGILHKEVPSDSTESGPAWSPLCTLGLGCA